MFIIKVLSTMKTQIGKWGNSLGLRIPKYVVQALHLNTNDEVECRVENGELIIRPIKEKEYTLDELLEGVIDKSEEVNWGSPVGKEEW